jgi:hypothetical protein
VTIVKTPMAVTSVILTLVMSVTGFPQTRPDFSGKWALNKAKSKERNPRQFKHSTIEVSQHDPELDLQLRDERPDGREFRAYLNLKTDGTSAVSILGSPPAGRDQVGRQQDGDSLEHGSPGFHCW